MIEILSRYCDSGHLNVSMRRREEEGRYGTPDPLVRRDGAVRPGAADACAVTPSATSATSMHQHALHISPYYRRYHKRAVDNREYRKVRTTVLYLRVFVGLYDESNHSHTERSLLITHHQRNRTTIDQK